MVSVTESGRGELGRNGELVFKKTYNPPTRSQHKALKSAEFTIYHILLMQSITYQILIGWFSSFVVKLQKLDVKLTKTLLVQLTLFFIKANVRFILYSPLFKVSLLLIKCPIQLSNIVSLPDSVCLD